MMLSERILALLKLGVEECQENYDSYAYEGECSEGKISKNPVVITWDKVHVGIKQANTADNEKY